MRRAVSIGCFFLATALCQGQSRSDLRSLYKARNWAELNNGLQNVPGMPFFRGAIGVTFNQDPKRSENLLLSVIRSAPHSDDAYEAYEWLAHLYLYRGQYRSLISVMERRWAAFPGKEEKNKEQFAVAGFRGLPNQSIEETHPAVLPHESGEIFIPVSINGTRAIYFFDTGAWLSCMSESEARRLGLTIRKTPGTVSQAAGARVDFRTAVAKDVTIGKTRLKDVSFLVFPDNEEPWADLPVGRRGAIGIPVLVALRTLQWNAASTLEIGGKSDPLDFQRANLAFDNDHLVISAHIENQDVNGTVDTGALSTDLYKPFADKFADLLKEVGRKDSTEIHGVGHWETFDSITIPELKINLGGLQTILSPAHVIPQSIGAACCIGNFGMDLFKQAPAFKVDFGAMTFQLLSEE